jgi:DNA processing protein
MENFSHFDLLKLALIPKISSTRLRNLIGHFKSPTAVLNADLNELKKVDLVDQKIASSIIQCDNNDKVKEQFEKLEKVNAKIITFWDDSYPEQLKNIIYPPAVLFVRGNASFSHKKMIAIVGTRRPSAYGVDSVKYFSSNLSREGITIVSGLAYGIDTLAHKTALEHGSNTIAVMGSGVDIIYPEQNKILSEEIIENGALVSEYAMGTSPSIKNFPARNRIISGLSLGVIVIESDTDGGSMITARFAFDQNREVYAIPGNINSKKSRGTNKLIKENSAKLVQSFDDILVDLNLKLSKKDDRKKVKPDFQLTLSENLVINILKSSQKHVDTISDEADLPISETLVTLLNLELKGLVRQLPGKVFEFVE